MTHQPDIPPQVAIIVSRYNTSVTDRLLEGALACYEAAGGAPDTVVVIEAPGAFELPALALAAARTGRFQGALALGCVIRGETSHDRYISQAVATGLVQVSLETGVPAAFGVLTVDSPEQAEARAGGAKGNKGEEAMQALLHTIAAGDALAAGASGYRVKTAVADKTSGRVRG